MPRGGGKPAPKAAPRAAPVAARPPAPAQGGLMSKINPFNKNNSRSMTTAPAAPPTRPQPHAPAAPKPTAPVAPAPRPQAAPVAAPAPAPAAPAPVAAPKENKAPGMFAQMAATAGGVAVGTTVGHVAGNALSNFFSGGNNAPAAPAAPAAPVAPVQAAPVPMAAPAPVSAPAPIDTNNVVSPVAPCPAPPVAAANQDAAPILADPAPMIAEPAPLVPDPAPALDTSMAAAASQEVPQVPAGTAPCAEQLRQFLQCTQTQADIVLCAGFLQTLKDCKVTYEQSYGVTLEPQFNVQ